MADRFAIRYDEHGVQLHNDYIGAIAAGVLRFWTLRGVTLDHPEHIYGLIHRDRKSLLYWEKTLKKEGLL